MGAVVTAVMRRRRSNADAADAITDTALILIEPLKQRVKELEGEISRLRGETRRAIEELRRLRAAVLDPKADLDELRTLATTPRHSRTH
jgi:chromosome segregation ATPase